MRTVSWQLLFLLQAVLARRTSFLLPGSLQDTIHAPFTPAAPHLRAWEHGIGGPRDVGGTDILRLRPLPSSLRHRGGPAAVWAPAGPWGARATASRWKPRLCTCQTTAHTCSCKYLGGGGGRVLYLEMAYLCWSTNAYERHNTVTPHLRVHGRGCRRRRLRCFTKHPPPHCRAAPRLGPPGPPSLPREEDGPRAAEAHEEAPGKASRNVSK